MTINPRPLPGLVRRDVWMAERGHCDRTGKRWQDRGFLVVRYLGRKPYVDETATLERLREADTYRDKKRPAT
jgi:hypothetical protein